MVPSFSVPLYVVTIPPVQYCSKFFLHGSHLRHESTKHPTPTLSPTLYRVTFGPIFDTIPVISCPGTIGNMDPPHSSPTWWMSVWHIPQYCMSTTISFSPGSRLSNENGANVALALCAAYPFTFMVSSDGTIASRFYLIIGGCDATDLDIHHNFLT